MRRLIALSVLNFSGALWSMKSPPTNIMPIAGSPTDTSECNILSPASTQPRTISSSNHSSFDLTKSMNLTNLATEESRAEALQTAQKLFKSENSSDHEKAYALFDRICHAALLKGQKTEIDCWAQLQLGVAAYEGKGINKDTILAALQWEDIATNEKEYRNNNAGWIVSLAKIKINLLLDKQDNKRALKYCNEVIEANDYPEAVAIAYKTKGDIYYEGGGGVKQDYKQALEAYKQGSTQTVSKEVKMSCCMALSDIYYLARGTNENHAASLQYAQQILNDLSETTEYLIFQYGATLRCAQIMCDRSSAHYNEKLGHEALIIMLEQTFDKEYAHIAQELNKNMSIIQKGQ